MRKLFAVISLFACLQVQAQKWQLVASLQPELNFHGHKYSNDRQIPGDLTKSTFSYGLGAAIKHNVSERIFVQAGLNLVNRKVNGTNITLDRWEMFRDSSAILLFADPIAFRTVEVPFTAGYHINKTAKGSLSLLAGFSFNYLVNTRYKNKWTFNKGFWQGSSLLFGAGYSKTINRNMNLQASAMYSFLNTVSRDRYLGSPNENDFIVHHKFLKMNLGLEWKLK